MTLMINYNHSAARQYARLNDDPEHAVFRTERIGLTHILRPEINLAVWQRDVPSAISTWLSQIRGKDLVERSCGIDRELSTKDVETTIRSELLVGNPVAREGGTELAQDAQQLADLFAQLSGSSSVRLRLDWVTEQQCPRFHADRVPMRLLCTYHGRATEWIANDITLASPDAEPDETVLNRFSLGDVAIMKGSLGTGHASPLRHRSPPLKGPAEWRLLLVTDPLQARPD